MNLDFLSDIEVDFDFDTELLESSAQDLLSDISPDLAETVDDFVDSLDDWQATAALTDGTISGTLSTGGDALSFDVELISLLDELIELSNSISGNATLEGGLFGGSLTIDGETQTGSVNVLPFLESNLNSFVNSLDFTAEFENGQFAINAPTGLGDFVGTLNFAEGDLALDLTTTPFGPLALSFTFPENAIIPFDLGTTGASGAVNLNTGQVEIPIFPGFSAEIPLSAISGSLGVDDGIGALSLNTSFGSVATEFEIGPLASELVEFIEEDVTGEFALGDGDASALVSTPFGTFEGTLPVVELAQLAMTLLGQSTGSLTLADGVANVAFSGPAQFDGSGSVADLDNLLSQPLATFF
ncbi:MAG: hypothetical protein F6J97_19855 [Leptolyngbya sp. SIO4C1]|nr:hypothetical protein [Leptolyngbya sp. SIO4C1]